MILDIKTFPNDILRKKATPVERIDDTILRLLDNMADTMYAASGVGLAAPQVGVSLRVVVLDEHASNGRTALIEAVNPEIIEASGEQLNEEGCLSIPGEYAFVKRYTNLKVKYLDRFGKEWVIETQNKLSIMFQHEIDHLNGNLFIDKLSLLKRETIKKHIKKRIQTGDYSKS